MMIMAVCGPTSRHGKQPWRAAVVPKKSRLGGFKEPPLMPEIGSTASGVFQCFLSSPTVVLQCATGIHVVEATKDI